MAETGSRMQAVSSIAGCAATSARDGDRSAYHVAPGGGRSSPRASRKVSGFAPRRGLATPSRIASTRCCDPRVSASASGIPSRRPSSAARPTTSSPATISRPQVVSARTCVTAATRASTSGAAKSCASSARSCVGGARRLRTTGATAARSCDRSRTSRASPRTAARPPTTTRPRAAAYVRPRSPRSARAFVSREKSCFRSLGATTPQRAST